VNSSTDNGLSVTVRRGSAQEVVPVVR
jgi:hypothetical protein